MTKAQAQARARQKQAASGGGSRPAPAPRHRPEEVRDERGVPYIVQREGGSEMPPPCPSSYACFKLLLSVRLSSAVWAILSDCDETFNYWEPLHWLLYERGLQTWEYSPEFALRSYLYLLSHALPGWLYARLAQPNPMYVFYFLRCLLGLACAGAEVYFLRGVRQQLGPHVTRLTLIFLLFAPGLYLASTALLPSSTSMILGMVALGAWFQDRDGLAIFCTALSALLSWPFAALLGLPIALDLLFRRRRWTFFLKWCLVSLVTILGPMVAVDSHYFGRLVVAPLNIVFYNVFTSHGPDLYGTEPFSFYFLNGFLNFNVAFVLALLAWPLQLLAHLLLPKQSARPSDSLFIPRWLHLSGLYVWCLVFFPLAHKEERFLFPVYPLIALAAACALDCAQKLYFRCFVGTKNRHYLDHTNWLALLALGVFALAGASRTMALYHNYSAPVNTWMHVSHLPHAQEAEYGLGAKAMGAEYNVCVGKEWHRFASSFFLPDDRWKVRFLPSDFRGQLPQPYAPGGPPHAARLQRPGFNDQNREEALNRFDVAPEECHFIVDLETGRESAREPRYAEDRERWDWEVSFPFLDAARSDRFFRSFYVPFVSWRYCKYSQYVLLRNKKPVVASASAKPRKKQKIRHL